MSVEPARGVRATWLYTLSSIVFFYGFFDLIVAVSLVNTVFDVDASGASGSAVDRWLAIAALVLHLIASAVQLRYCWFLRVGRGGGLPHRGWTIALVAPAAALWVVGLFLTGDAFATAVPLWAAATLIAALLPKPQRRLMLLLGAVVTIGHVVISAALPGNLIEPGGGSSVWMMGSFAVLLPGMVLTSLWWWEVVMQLDQARRTAAELAVTQERLRFASDLHDIQGHHLQVISLKSELAERLLEIDPAAAREHIHETRLIAKEALEETRSLVNGYRSVAFDDELENAREVLAASGAVCELRLGSLPSDASVQSVLASAVREATTNILRHSDATNVAITLSTRDGVCELRISNDGVTPEVAQRAAGSGLAGLRERLAAVGGSITSSLHPDGPPRPSGSLSLSKGPSFELVATVPVRTPAAQTEVVA